MKNFIKNKVYTIVLKGAKMYWRIVKPVSQGARIILIQDGKVLLVQHRGSRTWNLPGGGIKKSEDPQQAALRELYEETRIVCHETDYLLGTYYSTREGKQDTIFIFVRDGGFTFEKEVYNHFSEHGTSYHDIETEQSEWFPLNQLPDKTTPATKRRIQEYLDGKRDLVGEW